MAHTKVVVVGGGGTLGASTALHLLRAGYPAAHITVLDTYPIPSAQSAGNDLNKIMGIRTRNAADMALSLEALQMWQEDEVFRPFFHQTGRLDCGSSPEAIAGLRHEYQTLLDAGLDLDLDHAWLDSVDAIRAKVPHLAAENIQGWQALYSSSGGWLAAAQAIQAIGVVLQKAGVQFGFGGAGSFKQPLLDDSGACVGVETQDGSRYYADKVVLATGAWSPTLVDLEEQCCSKAWVYAHIQLTPAEAAAYRNVPVVYNEDYGFFFEPSETGIIKVCDEFPGFSRYKTHQPFGAAAPLPVSVPRSHAKHPTDTYPDVSETTIRRAIATYLPSLVNKPLVHRAMCWCTDTADSDLLICEHPRWRNLVLATGDSGHSFKLLPNIGKHIVALLEGRLSAELTHNWRWRPGGDARKSTRHAAPQDLADLPGWKHEDVGKL